MTKTESMEGMSDVDRLVIALGELRRAVEHAIVKPVADWLTRRM